MPDAAITTDIIVGFPGETEQDFQATLDVVAASRFAAAFTFQYSIRPGTPAATMPDQVPKAVVQERYERLVELVGDIAWRENLAQVGRTVEVLFADGEGRKDAATSRMSGRARDNRLVHVAVPDDPALRPRPGDFAETVVTYAAPHHLNADAGADVAAPHAGRGRLGRAARPTPGFAGGQPRVAHDRPSGRGSRRPRSRLLGPLTDPRRPLGRFRTLRSILALHAGSFRRAAWESDAASETA